MFRPKKTGGRARLDRPYFVDKTGGFGNLRDARIPKNFNASFLEIARAMPRRPGRSAQIQRATRRESPVFDPWDYSRETKKLPVITPNLTAHSARFNPSCLPPVAL